MTPSATDSLCIEIGRAGYDRLFYQHQDLCQHYQPPVFSVRGKGRGVRRARRVPAMNRLQSLSARLKMPSDPSKVNCKISLHHWDPVESWD